MPAYTLSQVYDALKAVRPEIPPAVDVQMCLAGFMGRRVNLVQEGGDVVSVWLTLEQELRFRSVLEKRAAASINWNKVDAAR